MAASTRVVLGESSDGFGEAAGAQGVDQDGLEVGVEDVGVEPGLADIDAGGYDGIGIDHSCIPVLLPFGAVLTLPFRSRRNGCDGPTRRPPAGPRQAPPGASLRWGREGSVTCPSGGYRHLRHWEERLRGSGDHPSLRHLPTIKGSTDTATQRGTFPLATSTRSTRRAACSLGPTRRTDALETLNVDCSAAADRYLM